MRLGRALLSGAAAGAAGTTALNAVTYLDMAVRGRPTSSTPQDTVKRLSDKAGVTIPGDQEAHDNRVDGLGPLTGLIAGVATGVLLGALRSAGFRPPLTVASVAAAAAAMVGTDGPMAALGVSDPRTWAAKDWVADIVPHIAYGAVTAALLDQLDISRSKLAGG